MKTNANNLMRAAAVVAAICLGRIATASAAAPMIQVWSQAVVQGERVRLGDLASVSDLDEPVAKAVLAVEVCKAPGEGNFENVDVERIRKALAAADVNLASVCITGSAECKVFRPAEPFAELAKAAASGKGAGQAEIGPQTLEASVREYLGNKLAKYEGRVEVRFAAANRTVLALAGKGISFHPQLRGNLLLGLITVNVDVLADGQVTRTIPVLAEVSLFKSVVVATRPINRGAAIRSEDINLQERQFSKVEDIGLSSVALAVNRQARRYLDPGEMLGTHDVQSLPLVRRGESVTVMLKHGGLTVQSSAKALRDGAQGERIDVKAEPGGQIYWGIVTGLKTVEAETSDSRQPGPVAGIGGAGDRGNG